MAQTCLVPGSCPSCNQKPFKTLSCSESWNLPSAFVPWQRRDYHVPCWTVHFMTWKTVRWMMPLGCWGTLVLGRSAGLSDQAGELLLVKLTSNLLVCCEVIPTLWCFGWNHFALRLRLIIFFNLKQILWPFLRRAVYDFQTSKEQIRYPGPLKFNARFY